MNDMNCKATQCIQRAVGMLQNSLAIPEDVGQAKPIQILVVGQPQQRIFDVLNKIFSGLDKLDCQILRGYHCIISYGDSCEYSLIKNGEQIPVSPDTLASKLSDFNAVNEPIECCITTDNSTLKDVYLSVIASSEDFEDVDWNEVLMHTDYCFFVLSATACLSMAERTTLRKSIVPSMEGALGVILTQSNFVVGQDAEDLNHVLDEFFEQKVPIFHLPDEDLDRIRLEFTELSSRVQDLRERREARISKLLLQSCMRDIEKQISVLNANSSEIDIALESVHAKTESLPDHMATAKRRARMMFTSKIKVDMNTSAAQFHHAIVEKLGEEICKNDNIEEMQTLLPSYIADQWNAELAVLRENFASYVYDINDELGRFVTDDIQNYIGDGMDGTSLNVVLYILEKSMYKGIDANMFQFECPTDSSKIASYGAVVSGVALAVLAHPIVGAAVAIFGSKHLKKKGQEKFIQDNKDALLKASEHMCDEIYRDVTTSLDEGCEEFEKVLSEKIEQHYQEAMNIVSKTLEEYKANQSQYEEKLVNLRDLQDEISSLLQYYQN